MRNRLVAVLTLALLAPSTALACAMPRHMEARALVNVMDEIDAAAAPAPVKPAEAAKPAEAQRVEPAEAAKPTALPTTIPEVEA